MIDRSERDIGQTSETHGQTHARHHFVGPSTDGRGAFQDPTHVSFWNSNSFWYYTKREQAQFIGEPVKFQLNRISNYFPTDWHKFHNILYTKAHLVKLPDDGIIPQGGREI